MSVSGAWRTGTVLADVAQERARQDAKWGVKRHTPAMWLAVLVEEVGEAAEEIVNTHGKDPDNLRIELLHVAAVAVSAIEYLDFGGAGLDSRGEDA